MHRLQKSSQYERDAATIATYISLDSLDAALRFFDAVEETETLLAQWPLLGITIGGHTDPALRRMSIKRFRNYHILYQTNNTEVLLLRIIHGSRNVPWGDQK